MESVDAETGGKRSGGTHFQLAGGEIFLDYEHFDDQVTAESKVKAEYRVKRVISNEDLKSSNRELLGKLLFVEHESEYFNRQFCLYWSNRNKFTSVCSEFEQTIVSFRNTYEL